MDIKSYIIDKAKELNIDMIGFTDGEPLLRIKEYLDYKKNNGLITEFEETDTEKRTNPKLTMSNCKSIIVIGISYNILNNERADYKIKGKLSKSSWGIDYHRVLKEKLNSLIYEMEKEIEFEYMTFVDTGPLVDRELAYKAGIGYYGKNNNIINERYGSFIFLGLILTNLDIATDNPKDSQCGDCNLCIKACPTGALGEPFKLNPKKCISYLTQTKNEIDYELLKKMGINIYGCDICQNVCPKNKDVPYSTHDEFIPKTTKGYIDIEELLKMSNKEFKEKYNSMSGSWRGRNVLKRNALINLGNMNITLDPFLINYILKEDNPFFRRYIEYLSKNIFLKHNDE